MTHLKDLEKKVFNFKKMFELKGSCLLVLFLIVLSLEYVSLQSKSVLKYYLNSRFLVSNELVPCMPNADKLAI